MGRTCIQGLDPAWAFFIFPDLDNPDLIHLALIVIGIYEEPIEVHPKINNGEDDNGLRRVYRPLVRAKRPGESFSDVIRRALSGSLRLSDIAGSKTVTRRDWRLVEEAPTRGC